MPDQITAAGLEVATQSELITQLKTELEAAYGTEINLEADTPDGQLIMTQVQAGVDIREVIKQVYTSFDPDQAFGKTLDARVKLNGVKRQAGTYTITPVEITVDRALNLFGLDQVDNDIFTIADNAGNQWQLLETQNVAGAGTYTYNFRAAVPGARLTIPNTINQPVTIVVGVTTINNPSTYTSLGVNEESDSKLKIRRQKSVAIANQGYLQGLLAALENINGVESAFIYENNTNTTDGNGVPPHCIWVIIAGSALPADIADAIYKKRNAGANMRGVEIVNITQIDGSIFQVRFDYVQAENLFIKFDATSIDGINAPNVALIKSQLVQLFVPSVAELVNINDLATVVQQIDGNTLVTNAGFGFDNLTYFNLLTPSAKNKQFVLAEVRIDITVI